MPGGSDERVPQAKHGSRGSCEAQHYPAMRVTQHLPLRPVLHAQRRIDLYPDLDAGNRSGLHRLALSGRAPDARLSETAGIWRREKASPEAHAADGPGTRLPETANQHPAPGTQALSVSFAGFAHHQAQSGLVLGHNVYPHAQRLPVPGGHHGLAQSQSPVLAAFQHHGRGLLRLGPGRGLGEVWNPDIFNTDHGSQFTSYAFTSVLRENGIRISMDGRGRWLDNVFIERLWRSLKYENVYLHAYETGSEAREGIGKWIDFYNRLRPHSSLGGLPPDCYYEQGFLKAA